MWVMGTIYHVTFEHLPLIPKADKDILRFIFFRIQCVSLIKAGFVVKAALFAFQAAQARKKHTIGPSSAWSI